MRHLFACARFLVPLAMLSLLSACASRNASGAEGGRGEITLVVENNLPTAGSLTVYALPEVGGRLAVGHVGAGDTETLRFNGTSPDPRGYRFMAQTIAGAQIASNSVTVGQGDTVHWNLSSNIAIVSGS